MTDLIEPTTRQSLSFYVSQNASTPEWIAFMEWRILIQVVAMQVQSLEEAHASEREEWKTKILDTLQRVNQKAQVFQPESFPSDIVPPLEEYHAPNVAGNWCDVLTLKLNCLFLNVTNADTLRTEQ